MTDRELLELAAKAAGISWKPAETDAGKRCELKFGLWLNIQHEPTETTRRRFNPLNDDGDAFRLAVKLNLLIDCASHCARPIPDGIPWQDGNDLDPYAATRRAIVRAAAELAKQEKS